MNITHDAVPAEHAEGSMKRGIRSPAAIDTKTNLFLVDELGQL